MKRLIDKDNFATKLGALKFKNENTFSYGDGYEQAIEDVFEILNNADNETDEESYELIKRASDLVGNPGTNISGSTDLVCDKWQRDYEEWIVKKQKVNP